MSRVLKVVRAWLPLGVVVTAFCGLAYLTVQQALRQGANDPQIQMAEDAAAVLDGGANPGAVVPKEKVEFSKSLAPFLIVFDTTGKPIASSGLLDGALPDYPMGALEAAKRSGENRVTWQPRSGVRIASVAVAYAKGYLVAGRNMREVEAREAQTEALAGIAWVVTMAAGLIAVVVAVW